MSANGRTRLAFRLPPKPLLLDWFWAGASAGLLLGLAEIAFAASSGDVLDPRLASLVLGIDSVVVASSSIFVGTVLRVCSVRPSRSGVVGAVVGPLLFAAIAGRFWNVLTAGGLPALIDFAGLMTAALFAVAAGLGASRLAERLEQRGLICAAPYVWGGVALLLAASERFAETTGASGFRGAWVATLLILAATGLGWVAFEIARRRESRAPRTFGWLLMWLVIASIGVAASPTMLPWIFYEPATDAPKVRIGPPNFLIAILPDAARSGSSRPAATDFVAFTLKRLALEGVRYEIPLEAGDAGVRAVLMASRQTSVVRQLFNDGYATAAILPAGSVPPELAMAELDAQPGAHKLLEGRLAWFAAASVLTGPALPLMRLLGLDTDARGADRLAERAKAWLLDWSMERAESPFFLFVDFRDAASPASGETLLERSDARLGDLLEHLLMLGVQDSTLVVALGGDRTRMSGRWSRAVVRAPSGWPRPTHATRPGSLRSGQLGDFLIAASKSETSHPVGLPAASQSP